jgi:purine-binding chemotaxis protein CheW
MQWEAHEETLVFPADAGAAPAAPGRIVLPSSGTAEEILAREAARQVRPAPSKAVAARPAGEAAPAAQPTLSFFTSAQARDEAKAAIASEHLATFFLEREEYGVDVRLVQEIIRVSEITQVPRAPEFIRGVINLRGRVIPVIDLKRKLGLGEFSEARGSRIVVVKVRERLIGLLVDGASQVLKVPLSVIEAAPDEVVEIDQNFIRGVAKLAGRLIILIDLPKVLQVELREALPGEPA